MFLPCPPLTCCCFKEHNFKKWEALWAEEELRRRAQELALDEPADWMTFLTKHCGLFIP